MTKYVTRFGSLAHYEKGGVEIIDDDPKRYAFSNIFEVASRSKPYEKVAVGKNMQYVLEVIRAEGTSEWWAAAHDEFALVMDGEVEVRLLKLADPSMVPPDREGSIRLRGEPAGRKMGRVQPRRGHMTRLPAGSPCLSADGFLRALQRDVAWEFFYGTVNFDGVVGTVNHYGTVDLFAGRYNDAYRKAELDHVENFPTPVIKATFNAMLDDWTNSTFDPFASPHETGTAFGPKAGDNRSAVTRRRVAAKQMVAVPGDEALRSDATGHPINRHFVDVPQDEPRVVVEPGFEGQVSAFNLFAYLSRSNATWNPAVVSVGKSSLYCPTTEEYILPIIHGNDRVEWFVQLSDEIYWDVEDRDTGAVRAKVVMKPGDVAAMPADIRHQGYSPKRAMLLVWENASPDLPALIASGKAPTTPVDF